MYKFRFKPNYWYWTDLGEEVSCIDPTNVSSSSEHMDNNDSFVLTQHMVDDAFTQAYDLQSLDDEGTDEEMNEEPPHKDAVIKTKPRGRVEMRDIGEDTIYQQDMAHIEQITEIEEMVGLHDETRSDEEVDALSIQIDNELEKDCSEDSDPDGDES